jgi:hypothetical protein
MEGNTEQNRVFITCVGVVMVLAIGFGLLELMGVVHV